MKVNIENNDIKYDIIIKNNLFNELDKYIDFNNKVLVLTDSLIPTIYINKFKKYNNVYVYIINSGEDNKNIDNYQNIISFMLDNEFSRSDYIVSLGGGVVTDLGGFVSSTYKRGINLISFPTSLLAMVDASIGGKTGINFKEIKNVIGTFYSPKYVLISTNTLKTLPNKEINNGVFEALKYGLIGDQELVNIIRSGKIEENYNNIIKRSIKVKLEIVKKDYKEENIRKYLNLGHTIGHAIEAIYKLDHGVSIGLGMIPFVNKKLEIIEILKKYINIDKNELLNYDINIILNKIKNDKKWNNNKLDFIYCEDISNIKIINLNEIEIKNKIKELFDEISIW